MLAILFRHKRLAIRRKATPNWQQIEYDWDQYFDGKSEDQWRAEFIPLLEGVIIDQGEQWNAQFGMQFDVRNILAETWFEDYVLQFSQDIVEVTQQQMNELLQQAIAEGWGLDKTANRIDLLFDVWEDQIDREKLGEEDRAWIAERRAQPRRNMIARTETLRASNVGSMHLFEGWGARQKEWLATGDNRTRAAHMAAWGRYTEGGTPGPIPMDQPFIVDGEALMYPGDPNGSPGNTINCRCTLLPYDPPLFAGEL